MKNNNKKNQSGLFGENFWKFNLKNPDASVGQKLILLGIILNVILPLSTRPFAGVLFSRGGALAVLSSALMVFALNVFFWAGLGLLWYVDGRDRTKKKSSWLRLLTFYAVFSVVILGVGALRALSDGGGKSESVNLSSYILKKPISSVAVERLINLMSRDREFDFYFQLLTSDNKRQISSEVAELLNDNWSKEGVSDQMDQIRKQIEPLIVVYAYMDDYQKYLQDPKTYATANRALWEIFFSEFKLSVLGLIYKSNFDPDFSFQWDEESRTFARNFREAVKH